MFLVYGHTSSSVSYITYIQAIQKEQRLEKESTPIAVNVSNVTQCDGNLMTPRESPSRSNDEIGNCTIVSHMRPEYQTAFINSETS